VPSSGGLTARFPQVRYNESRGANESHAWGARGGWPPPNGGGDRG